MSHYSDLLIQRHLYRAIQENRGIADTTEADVVALQGLLVRVIDSIGPHIDRISHTFPQYTDHGIRHLCNLSEIIWRIIPEFTRKALNPYELTLLFLGILLHDIGMYVTEEEKTEMISSTPFKAYRAQHREYQDAFERAITGNDHRRASAIEDVLFADYIRRLHPGRVSAYLAKHLADELVFREVPFLKEVATLCESHGWGTRESNDPRYPDHSVSRLDTVLPGPGPGLPVNLQYLAICLRLGDILDFDRSRTPVAVFDDLDFASEQS